MDNILLVFPPQWVPNHPYLSIPLLSAYLKKGGFNVCIRDINIEFYNNILKRKNLEYTFHNLKKNSNLIKNKASVKRYLLGNRRLIIENIENAKDILRTDSFYDFNLFIYNIKLIMEGLVAYSLSYPNFYLSFDELKLAYSPFSSKEVYQCIYDIDKNPFIGYFREYFFNKNYENIKLFGISIVSINQLIPGLTLAKEFRTKYPECKIVIGGNITRRLGENFKKTRWLWKYLDYLVIGDGEDTIKQIAENIISKNSINAKDIKNIPNLIYKNGHYIEKNSIKYFDLKRYVFPNYDDYPIKLYLSPEPIFSVEFSRGCYWGKCSFCEVANEPRREREIHSFAEEICLIKKKYNGEYVFITDIALPIAKINKAFKIVKNTIKEIKWVGLFRPEKKLLEKNTLYKLKENGCKAILLGIESANERILKIINKGTDPKKYSEILKNLNAHNIWTHCYFMFGLPTEKMNEIIETLQFIENNSQNINSFSISKYIMLKDTKLFLNKKKYGITIIKNHHHDWRTAYFTFKPSLQFKEEIIINKKIEKLFDGYPTDSEKWLYMHINYLFLFVSKKGFKFFYSNNQ